MSASEMVCHAADQLRVALGDVRAEPGPLLLRLGSREVKLPPGPLRSRCIRQIPVHRVPWRRTPFGAPPEVFATSPGRWPDDIAALHALVEHVGRKDPAAAWGTHPVFGRVSGQEWRLLCWRHLDYSPAPTRGLTALCRGLRRALATGLGRGFRSAVGDLRPERTLVVVAEAGR